MTANRAWLGRRMRRCVCCLLLLVPMLASNHAQAFFRIGNTGGDPFTDIVVTWDGVSDIAAVRSSNCVSSYWVWWIFRIPASYDMLLRDPLRLNGPGVLNFLPINSLVHVSPSGTTNPLIDGSWVTGFNTNNWQCVTMYLDVTILATDLSTREAGTYSNTLRLRGRRNGTTENDDSEIYIEVEIPVLAISRGLDTMDMGTWDGVTTPSASDSFCIGTNGGSTALLDVTLTSSNPNGANRFRMRGGPANNDFIRYDVDFTAPGFGSTIVSSPALSRSGSTWVVRTDQELDCTSMDFSLQVDSILGDIQAAGGGSYSDVLTVLVAPQ